MSIGLYIQQALRMVGLEKEAGQGFALVQPNGQM